MCYNFREGYEREGCALETENKTESRKRFLLNIAYWAVIVAIVYLVFKYLLNLLMPFFLAAVFAALVRPISKWLSRETRWKKNASGERVQVKRRFHLNPTVAGIVSVVVLFLILGGLLALILIRLVDTITSLVSAIPDVYYKNIVPGISDFVKSLEDFAGRLDQSVLKAVQDAIPNLISSIGSAVTNFSAKAVSWLSSSATKLPTMLLKTVICLIATVFIAVDFNFIKDFIRRNLPARPLQMVVDVKNSFLSTIWQFLKSYFIIFCITATEIAVGLLIIGMARPVLLGVTIAIFDAFPIVGSGMILLPWALITLLTGKTWKGIGLAILYATVVIVRQVIEPKIVGKHVGLRPLVTLICMFAGTKLFGAVGLFGLPITAAILSDLNNSGLTHLFKRAEPEKAAPLPEKDGTT